VTQPSTSPFAVRGVVEGFYGRPWTHAQRLDLIEFIAARGMNTFVYAPKDDPLLRRAWRVPYSGSDLERLSELADACGRHGLDFVYCLSPGRSIRYSSDDDVAAVSGKLETVSRLGVRHFGLLLDDIPAALLHEEDRRAWPDLVDAHIHLIGRVYERLEPDQRLIVCPTVYWGRGDEDYVARLGNGIDPRIDLFWTGRAICSPTLDLFDAATFARSTARLPTYWDNYPVNDVAMGHELHIGPYQGRDPHLWRFANGVIANGMEYFESSKIAFATIADYLAAPETYDPETSWSSALRLVAGDEDVEAFALFADNVRSSALSPDDAPLVTHALERLILELENGGVSAATAADVRDLGERLVAAADQLLDAVRPHSNPTLIEEARPWIVAFRIGAEALECVGDLAASGRLAQDGRAQLLPYLQGLRASRVRVFGDALDMTLGELTADAMPEYRTPGG
jgi:hyaluronoglucosaminidase